MGDELVSDVLFGVVNGRFERLGSVSWDDISVSTNEDERDEPFWSLMQPSEGTFEVRLPWYWTSTGLMRALFGEHAALMSWTKPKYLVPILRKGKKSHKGKELR